VLVGIVSELDALKVFVFTEDQILPHYADGLGTQVNKIMSSDVVAVDPETKLQRVLQMLTKHKVKSLPIIDQQRNLVGIIARENVMRAMERWTLRQ
jgi:CBS-domain-containing membrane protein